MIASALGPAHATAQESSVEPDARGSEAPVPFLPPVGPEDEETPTHPDYGFMAAGSVLFGLAYLISSITIASLAS